MTPEGRKTWNENFYRWNNFNEHGITYVAVGDTFSIKEELKKAGAKFSRELGWSFKEDPDEFETVKIHIDDVAHKSDRGIYHFNENVMEMMKEIQSQFIKPTNSKWVGEIGEKLRTWGTLSNTHQFQGSFGLTTVYTFKDEQGNSIVWMTTKNIPIDIGDFCEIRGTVKAHNTFRGDKQTLLSRCQCYKINE